MTVRAKNLWKDAIGIISPIVALLTAAAVSYATYRVNEYQNEQMRIVQAKDHEILRELMSATGPIAKAQSDIRIQENNLSELKGFIKDEFQDLKSRLK